MLNVKGKELGVEMLTVGRSLLWLVAVFVLVVVCHVGKYVGGRIVDVVVIVIVIVS